jgi:phage host-nuclease inhibitor protein Gam
LKAHPIPTFKGKKGMTEEQFNKAQENYLKALENYKKAMDDYSEAHTDCVGTKGKFCK